MFLAIVSTLKYEISIIKKLIKTEYSYYAVYMFTVFIKHLTDYIVSKKLNIPVSVFKFVEILKEENIISNEEEKFIAECISITRNKKKLITNHNRINKDKILEIIEKIERTLLS